MHQRSQKGFTLLEAIVALTIFSTVSMGLYSWINSMLLGTARLDELQAQNQATVNALEYARTVNPMERPNGSVDLGQVVLSWSSSPVEAERLGGQGRLFELGLYEMTVSIEQSGAGTRELVLRQVGYRKRQGATIEY